MQFFCRQENIDVVRRNLGVVRIFNAKSSDSRTQFGMNQSIWIVAFSMVAKVAEVADQQPAFQGRPEKQI